MKRLMILLLSLSLLLCACGTKTAEPEISYDEEEPVVVDQTDDIFAINYNSQDSSGIQAFSTFSCTWSWENTKYPSRKGTR